MYRVLAGALLVVISAGCSMGPAPVTTGFSDFGTASKTTPSRPAPSATLGGPSSTANPKVATVSDRAPRGAYETPRAGALSGRDYSHTQLDLTDALFQINAYRKEKGLRPLKLNAELTSAAKAHSRDLAKWDRISHYGSDGSNPWDRVKRTGYKPRLAAENVGTGQASFGEVLKGWKLSKGHNKNLLLADARHMGIALVQDPSTEFKTFWTLVIGTSM